MLAIRLKLYLIFIFIIEIIGVNDVKSLLLDWIMWWHWTTGILSLQFRDKVCNECDIYNQD